MNGLLASPDVFCSYYFYTSNQTKTRLLSDGHVGAPLSLKKHIYTHIFNTLEMVKYVTYVVCIQPFQSFVRFSSLLSNSLPPRIPKELPLIHYVPHFILLLWRVCVKESVYKRWSESVLYSIISWQNSIKSAKKTGDLFALPLVDFYLVCRRNTLIHDKHS